MSHRAQPSESLKDTVADRIPAHSGQPITIRRCEEVVPLVEIITGAMAGSGFPRHDIFGLRLALEEALVNAVKHGNQGDPSKRVQVRYQISAEQVLVQVEDQGPGFDPRGVPDPTALENLESCGGRGLLLIQAYTTWVQYNDLGNCVTLCKKPSR